MLANKLGGGLRRGCSRRGDIHDMSSPSRIVDVTDIGRKLDYAAFGRDSADENGGFYW